MPVNEPESAHSQDEDQRLKGEGTVTVYLSTYGTTGQFTGAAAHANAANIMVGLSPEADAEVMAATLRQNLASPSRTVRVSTFSGGGPSSNALELQLIGDDYAEVADTANRLTAELLTLNGLADVQNDTVIGT